MEEETAYLVVFFLAMLLLSSQEATISNTAICWDVSSSMAARDLDKELSVLEKLFERKANQEVLLLLFGIHVKGKMVT